MISGNFDFIVSLGRACAVDIAIQRRYGSQVVHFPFDGLITEIASVTQLVKQDFVGYMDNFAPTRTVSDRAWVGDHDITETKYGVRFLHHFRLKPDNTFTAIREDLKDYMMERVHRFQSILRGGYDVLFIRHSDYPHESKENVLELEAAIKARLPDRWQLLFVPNHWNYDQCYGNDVEWTSASGHTTCIPMPDGEEQNGRWWDQIWDNINFRNSIFGFIK